VKIRSNSTISRGGSASSFFCKISGWFESAGVVSDFAASTSVQNVGSSIGELV
jgi:hypothetical protein